MPINVRVLTQLLAYQFGCYKNYQLDYNINQLKPVNQIFSIFLHAYGLYNNTSLHVPMKCFAIVNEETWRCQLFFSSCSVRPAVIFQQIDQTVLKIILLCMSAQCYNKIEQRNTGQLIQEDPNQRAGLLIQRALSKCMNTLFIYSE